MTAPLFSIVTVTLNCRAEACRTAQSVLAQDSLDYEYLVKDGGSSDGTVDGLRALGLSNIQVEKDAGIYPAMNQALARCRGRYVWFLNAGDTFASPTVLTEFATHLQRHGFPAFIYGDVQSPARHPFWKAPPGNSPRQSQMRGRLTRCYLYRRMLCHQSWAVERALYQRCGGLDERFRIEADYDFLLKTILDLRVSYLRVPCVCIHYAGGGASERNLERCRLERQQILKQYFSPWERWLYEGLSQTARLVVHGRCFSALYPHLPRHWQARLSGF